MTATIPTIKCSYRIVEWPLRDSQYNTWGPQRIVTGEDVDAEIRYYAARVAFWVPDSQYGWRVAGYDMDHRIELVSLKHRLLEDHISFKVGDRSFYKKLHIDHMDNKTKLYNVELPEIRRYLQWFTIEEKEIEKLLVGIDMAIEIQSKISY